MDTPPASALTTVLFDIDGTLVDSNYLHVDAWDRAFHSVDHPVDVWRIHRSIGMDSAKLLDSLLGDDADDLGEEAKDQHTRFYMKETGRLRPFRAATDLITELARRGHPVVLATSAPEAELKILRELLDVDDWLTAVTSAEDVDSAKPDPDIVDRALRKAGATASRAVMVGDSVWDMIAAERAGVTGVGVLSGGFGRDELLAAGAIAVYDDVAALLGELDSSPISG